MSPRRRNPYPVLLAVAIVPALVVAGVGLWLQDQGAASAPPPATTPGPLPTELATPLLSVRRAPATLSREVNIDAFRASAEEFLTRIDDTSCVDLSVDGLAVSAKNTDLPLRPASNVKLVVGAVAAEVLGPDFRYRTEARGQLDGAGVVQGDLALVGGGDPALAEGWWASTDVVRYPPTTITPIETLADQLVAAGVTRVTGDIVGDGTRYDAERFAPGITDGVKAELEALPISALMVNDMRTSPTTVGNDPERGAAQVLLRLLEERGVVVDGDATAGVAPAGANTIASVESPPFPEVLASMLTTSDNSAADMIVKEIGLARRGSGSWAAGLAEVLAVLSSWGVPVDPLVLSDGAGLSDDNRLTCAALLAVLQHGSVDDAVGSGLPVAGADEGTLADSFEGTELEGVLRAKTGTLGNNDGEPDKPGAKTLSGYVPVPGGGAIEFSLLLNGEQIADQGVYRPIWDAFGALLASYPSGPTTEELAPR